MTFFIIINDLFNRLQDIFGDFYQKEHGIEIFWEMKIRASLLSNFYFEIIWLVFDFEYTSKVPIPKFKHNLISWLHDQLNSEIELSSTIFILAKYSLNIFEPM